MSLVVNVRSSVIRLIVLVVCVLGNSSVVVLSVFVSGSVNVMGVVSVLGSSW